MPSRSGVRTSEHTHLVVGHVCLDQLDASHVRLGGTSFFAAIRAAELGCDVTVQTACSHGTADLLRSQMPPNIVVHHQLTVLDTRFEFADSGPVRLTSFAGPLLSFPTGRFCSAHLCPIAGEIRLATVTEVRACADFVGVTPQGFMRRIGRSGRLSLGDISDYDLVHTADAIVVNEREFAALERFGTFLAKFDGPIFVTLGPHGAYVTRRGKEVARMSPEGVQRPARAEDTIGAGDVFASTAFLSLTEGESLPSALRASVQAATAFVYRQSVS